MVFQSVQLDEVQRWKINFLSLDKCTTLWSSSGGEDTLRAQRHVVGPGKERRIGPTKENKRPTSLHQRQIRWREWTIMYCLNTAEERWLNLKIQRGDPVAVPLCWRWDTALVSGQGLAKHLQSSGKRIISETVITTRGHCFVCQCVSSQFSTVVLLWSDFKRAICVKTSLELMAWEEAIWHLTLRGTAVTITHNHKRWQQDW